MCIYMCRVARSPLRGTLVPTRCTVREYAGCARTVRASPPLRLIRSRSLALHTSTRVHAWSKGGGNLMGEKRAPLTLCVSVCLVSFCLFVSAPSRVCVRACVQSGRNQGSNVPPSAFAELEESLPRRTSRRIDVFSVRSSSVEISRVFYILSCFLRFLPATADFHLSGYSLVHKHTNYLLSHFAQLL